MKPTDMLNYAFKSLAHSSLRTWLTIIGIIIGISSVIVLVSIGEGLNKSVNDQLAMFGTKTIVVIPVNIGGNQGGGISFSGSLATSGKLFMKDVDEIKKIASIDLITPVIQQRAGLGFKGKEITTSIIGIEPDLFQQVSKDVEIEDGRFLGGSDRNVVVLGNDVAKKSFGKDEIRVNNDVLINGEKFRVVGILKKTGSTFSPADSGVFINVEDARDLFSSVMADREISAIRLTVKEDADTEAVADEIKGRLRSLHRVRDGEEDFGVITPKFINDTVGSITSLLTVFLAAIAAISLVVGGVGIMNTMFMAVVERTREIGILKAIGASSGEILSIFLIESGMIGLAGGMLGVVIAIGLLLVAKNFGAPVYLDPFIIGGAFLFSFVIGLISGFVPSWNASRVSPLEALRYE